MNLRLQQFLNAENITQSQFADTIGVARGSISHILSGRNKPSFDLIESMARCFPALNIEWFVTGKGRMYKSYGADTQEVESDNSALEPSLFPLQETLPSSLRIVEQPKVSTSAKRIQHLNNQRNISRILVFFDDGTFQELVQDK